MHNLKAQFIVVEGLEGAGKSTVMTWVRELLQNAGITAMITTREPGGSPLAEAIRQLVKNHYSEEPVYPETECLLMYASRVQAVNHIVKPALAKGQWVISDRHELSTRAYQGGGRGLDAQLLETIHHAVLGDFAPQLTLYMDIEPAVGLERANRRGVLDRIETEALAFFERTRQVYLDYAARDDSIITIDAAQPLENVREQVRQALQTFYPDLQIVT